MGRSEEKALSLPAVKEQSAARSHGRPSLPNINCGMAAAGGAPVDVAVLALSRALLMSSLVVYVPETAVFVLSDDELAPAEVLKVV